MRTETCPLCQAEYDASGHEPGTRVRCGGCGEVLTVPRTRNAGSRRRAGARALEEGSPSAGGRRGRHRDRRSGEQEESAGTGYRSRRPARRNLLPYVLCAAACLGLLVYLVFGLLDTSIDPENASNEEKMSYVIGYTGVKLLGRMGEAVPNYDDALRILKGRVGFEVADDYFRHGWKDAERGRDPLITRDDIPAEWIRSHR